MEGHPAVVGPAVLGSSLPASNRRRLIFPVFWAEEEKSMSFLMSFNKSKKFTDADEAFEAIKAIYDESRAHLLKGFSEFSKSGVSPKSGSRPITLICALPWRTPNGLIAACPMALCPSRERIPPH